MARPVLNISGAFIGPNHGFASRVLTDGRSLHPLQRSGAVAHLGFAVEPAAGQPGLGTGPAAAGPNLGMPHVLNVSIVSATHQTRVS